MRYPCWQSIKIERALRKQLRLEQWHTHFVWKPIQIGNQCVWLETVKRKGRQAKDWYSGQIFYYWEYRFIDEE